MWEGCLLVCNVIKLIDFVPPSFRWQATITKPHKGLQRCLTRIAVKLKICLLGLVPHYKVHYIQANKPMNYLYLNDRQQILTLNKILNVRDNVDPRPMPTRRGHSANAYTVWTLGQCLHSVDPRPIPTQRGHSANAYTVWTLGQCLHGVDPRPIPTQRGHSANAYKLNTS